MTGATMLNRRTRGQSGYVLATVLGVVLLLTLIGVALLSYVFGSLRVTQSAVANSDRSRVADAALESALQEWRSQPGQCAGKQAEHGGITVTCGDEAVSTERRIMNLTAIRGTTPVGRARVKIVDEVNGIASPGYSLEVCDWRLGARLTESDLGGCAPDVP
jgi:Tfp pilus assembly protein PilX